MLAATTTAWGDSDPLDVVLQRIADHNPDVDTIELSIGARPVNNPAELLHQWSHRFRFVAHHTAPVEADRSIRPGLHTNPVDVAHQLSELGINRYTGHPPHRKHADDDTMWAWAHRWWETLAAHNIEWAVETMYRPRTRREQSDTGGYHLATPTEIWGFCDRATAAGWESPLLVDVSHLHIGWCSGDWTETDVTEVVAHAPATEAHVSTNDGRRDLHQPVTDNSTPWQWIRPHLDRYRIVVDEGRRHHKESDSDDNPT